MYYKSFLTLVICSMLYACGGSPESESDEPESVVLHDAEASAAPSVGSSVGSRTTIPPADVQIRKKKINSQAVTFHGLFDDIRR